MWLLMAACGGGGGAPVSDAAIDAAPMGCRSSVDCDDGLFCNGEEPCVEGECVLGAQVLCADDLDCTLDRCDEDRHSCVHEAPDADGDGHATIDCGGDDCDDADDARFPGNTEVCDADDHDEDCDPTTFGFRDADGDGWPDANCCNVDSAGVRACGDDCDDSLPTAHPSEAESCDGVDNDCDGMIDEDVTTTYTLDADGDRHGIVGGETREACFAPEGFAELADDCDDDDASVHPGAVEVCGSPAVDEDCDGVANPPDLCNCTAGESGACGLPGVCAAGTRDCIDGAWGACSIAGSAETCNGLDDDCDGLTDEGLTITCFADADNDGFASPGTPDERLCPASGRDFVGGCPRDFTNRAPFGAAALDCDDADGARFPGATELCDGLDNDCDGAIDEALLIDCFVDADRDGFAASGATPTPTCPGTGGACPGGQTGTAPSAANIDCNDGDASLSPAQAEVCDGLDNDCDGAIDEALKIRCFVDADRDGFAASGDAGTMVCPSGAGACPGGMTANDPVTAGADCDDSTATRSPALAEACNGVDDDCDGAIDEGVQVVCYTDGDGDGFAPTGAAMTTLCPAMGSFCPSGQTPTPPSGAADCDDTNALRSPALLEVCNHQDTDCDGNVDEGVTLLGWYPDTDGDGFGDASGTPSGLGDDVCLGDAGWVDDSSDCDDTLSSVYPGNPGDYLEPHCPPRQAPCDLTFVVTGSPPYTLRGCGRGGVCNYDAAYWDYDCSGAVESRDPMAGPSCDRNPDLPNPPECNVFVLGEPQCLGDSGFAYLRMDFGGNIPCGQSVPYRDCACNTKISPTTCGFLDRGTSGVPPTVSCH